MRLDTPRHAHAPARGPLGGAFLDHPVVTAPDIHDERTGTAAVHFSLLPPREEDPVCIS